jgi:cytochrome d ubiquinol oxidase subunit II
MAFALGSTIAALSQGITLGAILQGIRVDHDAYAGGWLDWLSPFTLLTGISVAVGYALLGATWLIWKTEGRAQAHARRLAFRLGIATLLALLAVSAATPYLTYDYWLRWFAMPGVLLTAQVPLLVLIAAVTLFWSLSRDKERAPFLAALALFLLGFVGLGISIYPYIVPRAITIWDAAAPPGSQLFMLVGAVFIIPIILIYTGWAYWVFRGKVGTQGYH